MEREKLKEEITIILKAYDENKEAPIGGFVQEIMYYVEQYVKEQFDSKSQQKDGDEPTTQWNIRNYR